MLRILGLAALALTFGACSKTTPAPQAAGQTAGQAAVAPAAQPATPETPPAQPDPAGAPAAPTATASTSAPSTPPPPLPDPLAVGSQDAKDDLYCSNVIFATYAPGEVLSPTDEAVRMKNEAMGMTIAQAGADKLMAQGAARVTQLGAISDAYADKVAKDMKAGKPRLSLETCMKRAAALPIPQ
jgi:hypothetical protein